MFKLLAMTRIPSIGRKLFIQCSKIRLVFTEQMSYIKLRELRGYKLVTH
jgi:hypothetical protein